MKEVFGQLWDYHDQGEWVAITTNGSVYDGRNIMGAGCALETAERFDYIPKRLATMLLYHGNLPVTFATERIITFPTKYNVSNSSDLNLIKRSCIFFMKEINILGLERIYLPRPGCGYGGLKWDDVKPVISELLDDRVHVITWR